MTPPAYVQVYCAKLVADERARTPVWKRHRDGAKQTRTLARGQHNGRSQWYCLYCGARVSVVW